MIDPTTPAEPIAPSPCNLEPARPSLCKAETGGPSARDAEPREPRPCETETGGTGGEGPANGQSNRPRETLRKNSPEGDTSANCSHVGPTGIESRARTDNKLGTLSRLREFRYRGLPVVFLMRPDGTVEPCPFLMSLDDVAAFFRLAESNTRFPRKTIERYRTMGLQSVRVGRRTWFRLDDVLRFLDQQQERVGTA